MRKTSAVVLFDLSVDETMSTDVGTALNCVPSGKIIIIKKKNTQIPQQQMAWMTKQTLKSTRTKSNQQLASSFYHTF